MKANNSINSNLKPKTATNLLSKKKIKFQQNSSIIICSRALEFVATPGSQESIIYTKISRSGYNFYLWVLQQAPLTITMLFNELANIISYPLPKKKV